MNLTRRPVAVAIVFWSVGVSGKALAYADCTAKPRLFTRPWRYFDLRLSPAG